MNDWTVYIVRCADNSLYTGITTDLTRRLAEHNGLDNRAARGARYTQARQPVTVVYSEPAQCRSTASKREYQIKKMTKSVKEALIQSTIIENDMPDTN